MQALGAHPERLADLLDVELDALPVDQQQRRACPALAKESWRDQAS
ncbi:hypothetical protein ACFQ0B_05500 [Nonomuraea thailandensis]